MSTKPEKQGCVRVCVNAYVFCFFLNRFYVIAILAKLGRDPTTQIYQP